MKNLIENKYLECEKELKININLSVEDVMFIKGKMEAYMNILQSLKDYNIITAPKSIKLSEILGRLNEKKYRKFEITRNGICISLDNTNCYRDYLNIEDNKIVDISDDMQVNEFKWLYALWIAETTIEDDLGVDLR